ncbi:MAG: flagellar biosynthesis protein FlhB [Syntrophorhabdus aromaticivorans]|uniref:Flagellar biosynthetic protein FlhB n=1 Tax=Syntrophorhabdus aromaticivorans TaxID=328301 RepID=A0A971M701_9BACT|nr:flagellar biosynthesis protein FlhB [Syntrophorhabdus aromaticivorans]
MADSFQEKTEQPTDKRLTDAKKRGQVAQSKEVSSCLMILFTSIFLYFAASHGFQKMFKVYAGYARNINLDINATNIYGILSFGVYQWLWTVAPIFALLVTVGILSAVLQTGFMWSPEALQPKFEKLNPLNGIKNLFSKKSAVEVLKSILKIVILGYIAYSIIVKELPAILSLPAKEAQAIVEYLGTAAFALALKVGLAFLAIAVLDLFFQKWQHKRDLMMTQQEVKEESKEREGNPMIKSRIKSLQREMARMRMIEDVKTADVVVTNPTRLAVALKYSPGQMPAPKIVARGAGFVAEKIREVAGAHGVPLMENKPLARALFHAVKVGDSIPEEFYVIVAELLAQVYREKNRVRF